MDISALQHLYRGFWIDSPVGNNAFSFARRLQQKIYVPPLVEADLNQISTGEKSAFVEMLDGREVACPGLAQFVYCPQHGKPVFIFDNHNHAFCFWYAAFLDGIISKGTTLLHVDQHKDTREPLKFLSAGVSLAEAFQYTQNSINVGNFIPPAVRLGVFNDVIQVNAADDFNMAAPQDFVLDIDLDIFAPVMDYIPEELKLSRLREWISRARLITISTSPFFIDQVAAIKLLQRIF